MNVSQRKYYGKLLLLGEYTILEGGSALAFPIQRFSGEWQADSEVAIQPAFWHYLEQFSFLDRQKIRKSEKMKLGFDSDIPQGYGLGSSGALTAACYDLLRINTDIDIHTLREQLSMMEAYFHGKSSGMDPLCSFLNACVVSSSEANTVYKDAVIPTGLFLLDSQQQRQTEKLVGTFREKMKTNDFARAVIELKKLNAQAISDVLLKDNTGFRHTFEKISRLQFIHFKEMITSEVEKTWQEGLNSGNYFLKLNGAGGGGFYLGLGQIDTEEKVLSLG